MKTKQSFILILLLFLFLASVNLSCNSTKTAVSCPEISIKKSDYRAYRNIRSKPFLVAHNNNSKNHNLHRSKRAQNGGNVATLPITVVERNNQINRIEYNNSLLASIDNTFHPISHTHLTSISRNYNKNIIQQYVNSLQEVKCDTIILKSGTTIIGRVEEVGLSELKFRRCNNLTGPIISLLKSDVSRIHYSNGTSELFGPTETSIPSQNYNPNQNNLSFSNTSPAKVEGFGLAGFISGLVGLFIASIPLGIIAVVFGGISLSKIKKNPQRYKGRGFAIASIILGIVDVVAMLILLGSL